MKLGRFRQAPLENKRYVIDYSQWLDTNELLTGLVDVYVDHVVNTPLVVNGVAFLSNNTQLVMFVTGGDDGETYQVDIVVRTTAGQIKEDSIIFAIALPESAGVTVSSSVVTQNLTGTVALTVVNLTTLIAALPTNLPTQSGILWNNGGVLSLS